MSLENNIRVLLVDDELGMRESCGKLLESEGFEVELAEDGLAGWTLFQAKRNFTVVLADLKMPRMGGLELVEKIHAADPDVVLLVITAFATIETAVEATKRGAYSYVPKPFTPDELLLPIRNGLERRALTIEARQLRQERENRLLELAYERSQSRTIINCMTDGVLVVNRDRQVVMGNAAAARMLAGHVVWQLPMPLDQLDSADFQSLIDDVFQSRELPAIMSRQVTRGEMTFMLNASSVTNPAGEILGTVMVVRDITELKKLELAKSRFVAMVAHEVKSPLAVIEGFLGVLLSDVAGKDPVRDRVMLEKTMNRARLLRQMITELMNLRAMETGHFSVTRVPLNLHEVVREILDASRDKAATKRLTLVGPTSGPTPFEVIADRTAVHMALNDLVDNAIKYTPDDGRIEVIEAVEDGFAAVTVSDTGIGLDPEEQRKIFEEFYRVKNAYTANVHGTGLGLSIVKRLVELHGGDVSVISAPGKGSAFKVRLPLAEPSVR